MSNTRAILDAFRLRCKEFMEYGASPGEAQALAAAELSQPATPIDLLRNVKNRSDVIQYAFRGLILTVSAFGIKQTRDGSRQIVLQLKARASGVYKEVKFKGEQALRLAILLMLKYEQFEDDLVSGFSLATIMDREEILSQTLISQQQRIDRSDRVDSETFRNIRRKIESELGILGMISTIGAHGGHRIEVAPNNIIFDPAALSAFNLLTNDAATNWYDRYQVSGVDA